MDISKIIEFFFPNYKEKIEARLKIDAEKEKEILIDYAVDIELKKENSYDNSVKKSRHDMRDSTVIASSIANTYNR